MEKQEYKSISKRARILLSGQEGFDVDFKKSLSGLDSEDIVAFANSDAGGVILIGIEETKTFDGRQKGEIVGCPIGDEDKRKIIDRAENCMPPIETTIIVENANSIPFFRVEIPSGPEKPYCTSKGTYKVRGDGVNKPLTPQRLLAMFMENEGQAFIERFKNATKGLENELSQLLDNAMILEGILQRTFDSAENTESLADEAMAFSEQSAVGVEEISVKLDAIENGDLYDIHRKINALLEHFGIEDPRVKAVRTLVEDLTEKLYRDGIKEDKILQNLKRQWDADAIYAAWSEVNRWAKNKLANLKRQESQNS